MRCNPNLSKDLCAPDPLSPMTCKTLISSEMTPYSSIALSAGWVAPPVPEEWWQTIRDTRPAYDPRTTRTERMGVLAETVRTWPGAVRSMHPQTSFGAIGAKAEFVTEGHALDSMLGENSPL